MKITKRKGHVNYDKNMENLTAYALPDAAHQLHRHSRIRGKEGQNP